MKEQSLFIEFMGDSPKIRIIDYLLTMGGLDFSITDMARNVTIGRTTLYRIWDQLLKNKIILSTRVIGKSKLYKLNKENPKIQKIMELDDMLIIEDLKKRVEKQKVKLSA